MDKAWTNVVEGDAQKRAQRRIIELYEETPELEKEMPVAYSKVILASQVKTLDKMKPIPVEPDERGFDDATIKHLCDHILEKDQVITSPYIRDQRSKIQHELQRKIAEHEEIEQEGKEKQDRYIRREQEYRKTIEDLQDEIESKTIGDKGMKRKLDEVKEVHTKLNDTIEKLQHKTAKVLQQQEKDIITIFNNKLNNIKKQIETEKNKKTENTEGFKERENELKEHLELITNIAQRIDAENRQLIKKNNELRIEYKSQKEDSVTLRRKLDTEKRKTNKIKEEIEYYQRIVNEAQDENEEEEMLEDSHGRGAEVESLIQGVNQSTQSLSMGGSQNIMQGAGKMGATTSGVDMKGKTVGFNVKSFPSLPQKPYTTTGEGESTTKGLKRYEKIIEKLKKMLNVERKNLRQVRTLYANEVKSRNELEQLLRMCVDDVKNEISKKRAENRVLIHSLRHKGGVDDIGLTQEDREKIIEVLLSQERVLTLLYDKTFPPKLNSRPLPNNMQFQKELDNLRGVSRSSQNSGVINQGEFEEGDIDYEEMDYADPDEGGNNIQVGA